MTARKIIEIDESLCDGCGQCVPSCAEGALRIENGKARLVADSYCDGLGACLGECPRGAISVVERDAAPFDAQLVHEHLASPAGSYAQAAAAPPACPGSSPRSLRLNVLADGPGFRRESPRSPTATASPSTATQLRNWPIQLSLVPPHAPFLYGADLLLVADCVPVAHPNFHRQYLNGSPLVLGCPKLDNGLAYVQKLAQIVRAASLQSITVLHMEVPCCTALMRIAEAAVVQAAASLPVREITISVLGEELSADRPVFADAAASPCPQPV